MQYDPNSPIWLQVMTVLETDIVTGKRPPGDKLPGGGDLAIAFSINPNTAVRVYQELEKQGLCETRRGLGTFVTEDAERIAALRKELALRAVRQFGEKLLAALGAQGILVKIHIVRINLNRGAAMGALIFNAALKRLVFSVLCQVLIVIIVFFS